MRKFEKHIFSIYYFCNKLHYIKNKSLLNKIILKILYKYYSIILNIIYGSFIPYKAKIGQNVNFLHGFHGVFISQNAVIGNNCTILHHVTIGSNIQKEKAPVIGNNVFIGCNVCIIGSCKIEDNVKVGAGVTIVNKEIKSNSIIYVQNYTEKRL